MNTNRLIESRCRLQVAKMGPFWEHLFAARCASGWLAGPVQKILAEDHTYYNHYAIEFAFKKAMNLDTMAVVHFAISTCK